MFHFLTERRLKVRRELVVPLAVQLCRGERPPLTALLRVFCLVVLLSVASGICLLYLPFGGL